MSYLLDYTGQEINENLKTASDIFNLIYPVGSIYMSVNSISPATLFGGTWEQNKDTFLLSAGKDYQAGATGGEAAHTLTTAEMPSHTHRGRIGLQQTGYGTNLGTWELYWKGTSSDAFGCTSENTITNINSRNLQPTTVTGSSTAHNNMPPYLVVYMWKRMA